MRSAAGELVLGKPFVKPTWAQGLDLHGRSILADSAGRRAAGPGERRRGGAAALATGGGPREQR